MVNRKKLVRGALVLNKGVNMHKKKKDNKKPTNNFEIEKLNSYKNCKLDIQNLQKISEKVEQTGLVALVGLAKKIVSFYNDVYDHCEKNKLKTTDYFNLTTIRKNLYELVDYPQQEDADGKPIRNYVFENAVSRSIKLAFVLINKEFTIENGMLTPTLKLKRKEIIKNYKQELENLY